MRERFSEQAQDVLAMSQKLVRRYLHKQWDVEHVLLALLDHDEGVMKEVLRDMGIDTDTLRGRVEVTLESLPKIARKAGRIHATPRIAALLEGANREADMLQDELIDTGHLLVVIAGETNSKAAAILLECNVTRDKIYRGLERIRGGNLVTERPMEGRYRALDQYGYDLTAMARQGKLEPVTGRDYETNQVIEVLARRQKSPLLVGDFNVDKLSIVQALVHRIVGGDVPGFLQASKIVALDCGKLLAGAKFRGEFEERVAAVVADVRKSEGEIIPYFDELWVGAAEGGLCIGSMLKLTLAVGELKCIASTVPEYLDSFRDGGLLSREFRIIYVGNTESAD